jgi:hypothetical protein
MIKTWLNVFMDDLENDYKNRKKLKLKESLM